MTRILLIEGPESDRDLLWAFFNGIRCELDMVVSREEAIEAFGLKQHDLVISDVRPPRGNGFEITREIHDMSHKLTPFLFISGSLTEVDALRHLDPELDVIGLLRKPIFIVDLVYRIRDVLKLPPEEEFIELLERLEPGDAGVAALDDLLRGSGDLSRIPLGRVIYAAFETRRTGRLTVSSEGGLVHIYTFRGEIIYLESEREQDSLIQALRARGQLDDFEMPPGAEPTNIEEEIGLLMAMRAIQPHKVPEALTELLTTVLATLSMERSGGYRMEPVDPPNRFMEAQNPVRLLLAIHARIAASGTEHKRHKPDSQLVVRIPLSLDLGRWNMPPVELKLANRLRTMVGRGVVLQDFMRVYAEGDAASRKRVRAFLSMMEDVGYLDFRPPMFDGDDDSTRRDLLAEAHRIRHLNHFQLLRVRATDDQEKMKEKYLAAARQYHPDRFYERPDQLVDLAAEILEKYQTAYSTLAKEKARKQYLTSLSDSEAQQAGVTEEQLHNPVRAAIFWKEAERFMRVAKWDLAFTNLTEAVRYDATRPDYEAALGWALFNKSPEKQKTAMLHLRNAVKADNNCDRAHYYLGMIAKKVGDLTKAERYFSRAVSSNSENVEAARELRLMEARGGGDDDGPKKGFLAGLFSRDPEE